MAILAERFNVIGRLSYDIKKSSQLRFNAGKWDDSFFFIQKYASRR